MAKFVLIYRGGTRAETPAEQEAVFAAWTGWLGGLGSSLADAGGPFGENASVGAAPGEQVTGYSIVDVESIGAAKDASATCPILTVGGSVDIYELLAM